MAMPSRTQLPVFVLQRAALVTAYRQLIVARGYFGEMLLETLVYLR
jgi:hypothetical protein